MTSCGSAHPHLITCFSAVLRRAAARPRPLGSLHRSTRFVGFSAPRRAKHQNIFGRVDILIIDCFAIGTRPLADLKRHLHLIRSARTTSFTVRREAIHDKNTTAIPLRLVLKLAAQHKQSAISHRFAQVAVSQHSLDIQILQANYLVLVNQLGRDLV